MGLVTGLKGTGDGGKFLPMAKAMGMVLRNLDNRVDGKDDLKDVANVALVLIEATVPANGIRRGQRIDCFVQSIGSAKSLRGGRLMVTPLGTQVVNDERAMGMASGAVLVEDPQVPTSGKIAGGVVVTEDVINEFVQNNKFTLLLDHDHASFRSASEVASVINADTSVESNGENLAWAKDPGVVEVTIPDQYRKDPMRFIAQVLDVQIDNPHTQARVVVNAKAGTVIVTGEVEISPVAISHKKLVAIHWHARRPGGRAAGRTGPRSRVRVPHGSAVAAGAAAFETIDRRPEPVEGPHHGRHRHTQRPASCG